MSRRRSHVGRRSVIHCWATERPADSIRQVRTRPVFSVWTRPLSSSTCRCWTTAARVMLSGSARRETETGPWLRCSMMARRVGSPRAWKTRSISGFFLGIGLAVVQVWGDSIRWLPAMLSTSARVLWSDCRAASPSRLCASQGHRSLRRMLPGGCR